MAMQQVYIIGAKTINAAITDELDKLEQVGKVDWGKILELIMQLLPIIFTLFTQKGEPSKTDG